MKITSDILLEAYRRGFFPMAESRQSPVLRWFDPDFRGILPFEGFHVPRRLLKTLRQGRYAVTFNKDFFGVIRACAEAREETWINDQIIALYTELHKQGYGISAEAWTKEGALAGGLYGIAIGGTFFGESMFSIRTDASKAALVHLMARLWKRGFTLVDAQFMNKHLVQFGMEEIPRAQYHALLERALEKNVSFLAGQSSASSKEEGISSSLGAGSAGLDSGAVSSSGRSSVSSSVVGASAAVSAVAGVSSVVGVASGSVSDENVCAFAEVAAFLQSMTQTS